MAQQQMATLKARPTWMARKRMTYPTCVVVVVAVVVLTVIDLNSRSNQETGKQQPDQN